MNALNTALQSTQTTVQETLLSLPQQLKAQLPLSAPLKLQIAEQRQTIQNILAVSYTHLTLPTILLV